MLSSDHKQPPNPQASRLRVDRNVGDVKQPVERLQEHETRRFFEELSYDGFAFDEPLQRDGWTFGGSGKRSAQRAVTDARRLLCRPDGFNLVLSQTPKNRRFGVHPRILSGTALLGCGDDLTI